jgi:hypothetical protein
MVQNRNAGIGSKYKQDVTVISFRALTLFKDFTMTACLVVSIATILCLFILFLVVSRTLNNIINQLVKMQYLVTSAVEYGKEHSEIERMLSEQIDNLS